MNSDAVPSFYPPRRRRWLELVLLAGFLLCVLVGLAALGALVYTYQFADKDESFAQTPLAGIDKAEIAPPLALMMLAGDPADALAHQALSAGQLATGHALLALDAQPTGGGRVAAYLQLARAYAAQNNESQAIAACHLVRPFMHLDSSIPPLERAQSLIQCAELYAALDAQPAAADALTQATRLGAQTPSLLPAHRSRLFETMKPLALQLDDGELAGQVTEYARNPYLAPAGHVLTPTLFSLVEPLPADAAVEQAVVARRHAARVLAERINFTGGIDIEPERQALAAALLAEDQARRAYAQAALTGQLTPGQQLGVVLERRSWAAAKLMAGLGGFGVSLVPEWEAGTAALFDELSSATANVDVVAQALIAAQPTAAAQAALRAETLTWLALQSDLGLYPNAPRADLDARLRRAQEELAAAGLPLALPLALDESAAPPGFRIQRAP